MTIRNLALTVACAVFALAAWAAQTQNAQTQNAPSQNAAQGAQTQAPSTADPYANNAAPGATQFPSGRAGRQRQQRQGRGPVRGGESGPVRSGHVEIRARIQCAGWCTGLESGEAQDDARRQGDRRDAFQRYGSCHVLRDGECRL